MINGASCKFASIHTIRIKILDRIVRTLLKHVPNLMRNLFSLSTVDTKKYKYNGEGGALKFSKGPRL